MTPIGSGCPRCRAERIKASPLPLIDGAISLFTRTHRYRCSACGWTGRRRRLKRRQHSQPSLAPRTAPEKRAVVFFVFVIGFLLITGGLLMRSCNQSPRAPIDGGSSE